MINFQYITIHVCSHRSYKKNFKFERLTYIGCHLNLRQFYIIPNKRTKRVFEYLVWIEGKVLIEPFSILNSNKNVFFILFFRVVLFAQYFIRFLFLFFWIHFWSHWWAMSVFLRLLFLTKGYFQRIVFVLVITAYDTILSFLSIYCILNEYNMFVSQYLNMVSATLYTQHIHGKLNFFFFFPLSNIHAKHHGNKNSRLTEEMKLKTQHRMK